jgi:hypothetical protein
MLDNETAYFSLGHAHVRGEREGVRLFFLRSHAELWSRQVSA